MLIGWIKGRDADPAGVHPDPDPAVGNKTGSGPDPREKKTVPDPK